MYVAGGGVGSHGNGENETAFWVSKALSLSHYLLDQRWDVPMQRNKWSNESIYLLRKMRCFFLRKMWCGGLSLWLTARRITKVNPDRTTWVLLRKCQLDSSGRGAHYRDGCNRLSPNILFLGFKKLFILRYPFRLTDLQSACIAFIQLPLTNLSPSYEWWTFVTKFLHHGSSPIFFSFCCVL